MFFIIWASYVLTPAMKLKRKSRKKTSNREGQLFNTAEAEEGNN
jgi:hypothetical protein